MSTKLAAIDSVLGVSRFILIDDEAFQNYTLSGCDTEEVEANDPF